MIRDLLNPSSGFLDLREDSKGVIQVAGITEVSTINAQEVRAASRPCTASPRPRILTRERPSVLQIMELLMKGNKQRTQEPTAANQTSSRSHAVLQVAVRQQSRCRDVLQEVRFARLFMIDLAGSERAAQVCAGFISVLQSSAGPTEELLISNSYSADFTSNKQQAASRCMLLQRHKYGKSYMTEMYGNEIRYMVLSWSAFHWQPSEKAHSPAVDRQDIRPPLGTEL